MSPLVVILSSPSGGGKTTIVHAILARRNDCGYSISATTRAPRGPERDGVDYYFLSREEFQRRRDADTFLEWAEYGGHLYGTPAAEVARVHAAGRHVLLDIDVQGARQVRERRADAVAIFVLPPTGGSLLDRLVRRGLDDAESLGRRLQQADRELAEALTYDYVVVNDEVEAAARRVEAIIEAETLRGDRQPGLAKRIDELRREVGRRAPLADAKS
jgi:guanylate kinase